MKSSGNFVPTCALLSARRSIENTAREPGTTNCENTELLVNLSIGHDAVGVLKGRPTTSSLSSVLANTTTPKKILKSSKFEKESIVVAVDATNKQGGGLLRLSRDEDRKICYYSVSWTGLFDFQGESQKFEMTNALIAMNLFAPTILKYLDEDGKQSHRYHQVIFKTDNNFFQVHNGFDDPFDLQFFKTVMKKASSLKATFKHVLVSQGDVDMINCDHLSRDDSAVRRLKIDYQGHPYSVVNLSETVDEKIWNSIRDELPAKYVIGYTNKYD